MHPIFLQSNDTNTSSHLSLSRSQLKQQNLCKNVLRAVRASADLPGVEQFPKAHRVTYRYYLGVLNFLEEDYKKVRLEV